MAVTDIHVEHIESFAAPDDARPGVDRRRLRILGVELVFALALVAFAAKAAPSFVDAIGRGLARLADPDLGGLAAAAAAEAVSLIAMAQVPRWLLAGQGVRISRRDALVLAVAANGMAVILPAGTVTSSVWSAHQYNRRGASAGVAAWVVLAAGFVSSVSALVLLVVGAMIAHVTDELLLAAVLVLLVAGSGAFVRAVHAAARLASVPDEDRSGALHDRVLERLAALAGEAAGRRAGWRVGSLALGGATVNWLADAACLGATFALLRMPVPWTSLLLAYTAGQVVGALVPLPGGLGAVEGGMVGVLVAYGVAAGPALAVVTVYRMLGYWIPTAVSVPAFALVKRHPDPWDVAA
jgi:uncharacterized membrane protein YbhN (UPF0104 family)